MSETNYTLFLAVDTGNAKADVEDLGRVLVKTGRVADEVFTTVDRGAASVGRFGVSSRKAGQDIGFAQTKTEGFTRATGRADVSLAKVLKTGLAVAGAWLTMSKAAGALTGSVSDFREIETALIGVSKTTGIVGPEIEALYDDVLLLATGGVPILTSSLLDIGAAAGQLGVTGSANILAYVETIGKLGAATDLQGEDAAKTLTRIMNVQGEGPENIERLASVLVRLGNTSAASESEIANVAKEVALATASFKIGSTNAAGYGAALASMGVRAQLGGSVIGRTMREIQLAVSEGGRDLERFADIADVSSEDFAEAWKTDPVTALNSFLKGLRRFGADAGAVLESVGLAGDEVGKVLPPLAANFELLAEKIATANDESVVMTALNKEAEAAFSSLDSDVNRLRNSYKATSRAVGVGMVPALRELIAGLLAFLETNREAARELGEKLGSALSVVGDLLLAFLENLNLVKSALIAFLALKAATWFVALLGSIGKILPALKAYFAAQTAAAAATTATAVAVQRTSPILDQYGKAIITTTTATKGATAAGSSFLTLAITPLAIGLTALLGAVLFVNNAISDWSDDLTREINEIIDSSEAFFGGIARIKQAGAELIDVANQEAEVKKRLLSAGISPEAEAAANVRAQVAAEFQRKRVDLLGEQEAALVEATAKESTYQEQLDGTVKKLEELEPALAKARAALSPTESGGFGDPFGFSALVVEMEGLREEETRLTTERNEAHITANTLAKATKDLRTEAEAYKPAVVKVAASTKILTDEQRKQADAYAAAVADIRATTIETNALAVAYGKGEVAVQAQLRSMEVESRLRASGIKLIGDQEDEMRGLISAQIEAEKTAVGAASLEGLRAQLTAQEAVNAAYSDGSEAVLEAVADMELEEAQRLAVAAASTTQAEELSAIIASLATARAEQEKLTKEASLEATIGDLQALNAAYVDNEQSILDVSAALAVENAVRRETNGLIGDAAADIAALVREREKEQAILTGRQTISLLQEEVDHLGRLSEIRREDFLNQDLYTEAVRQENIEREVRLALLDLDFQRSTALAAVKREDFTSDEAYLQVLRDTNTEFAIQAGLLGELIRKRGALDTPDGAGGGTTFRTSFDSSNLGEGIGLLIEAFKGGDEQAANLAEGLNLAVTGIVALGTELGIFTQEQARNAARLSRLGSQIGGAFGGTGGAIGGAVGAAAGIAGVEFGRTGNAVASGAAAGAAFGPWGVLIGAFVGLALAAIHKTEQTFADGSTEGGRLVGQVIEGGGKLAKQTQDVVDAITDTVNSILDTIGGTFSTFTTFAVQIRKDSKGLRVWVNGVKKEFGDDVQAALDFAVSEIFRQTEVSGTSPAVAAALNRFVGSTVEDLQRILGDALTIDNLGLTQFEAELHAVLGELNRLLVVSVQELGEGFENVLTGPGGIVSTIQSSYDALFGVEEDREAAIRGQIAALQAQIILQIAHLQGMKAEILTRKADVEAQQAMLEARNAQREAFLANATAEQLAAIAVARSIGFVSDRLLGLAGVTASAGTVFGLTAEQTAASLAAIDAALAALSGLDFSEGAVNDAIRRALAAGGGGGGRAGGGRREQTASAAREIEELRRMAEGVGSSALDLSRSLGEFDAWIAAAERLGFAERTLAQARIDNFQLIESEILAPFLEIIQQAGETDLETQARQLAESYQEALDQAFVLATDRARVFGTDLADEFGPLRDTILDAFGIELADGIRDQLSSLAEAGDASGLRDLLDSLQEMDFSGISPDLQAGFEELLGGLVDEVNAAIAAVGGDGGPPTPDVDLSPIREFLDLLTGLNEFEQAIQDLQGRFALVIARSRAAGASEEELATVRAAHSAAIDAVRESIMESVQTYTDAVLGISDFQRRLIDLQSLFTDARAGLDAVNAAEDGQDGLFGQDDPVETARRQTEEIMQAQIDTFGDVVTTGMATMITEVAAMLGSAVKAQALKTAKAPAAPKASDAITDLSHELTILATDGRDAEHQMQDVADSAADLSDEMALLDAAQQRAIQRIGIDFIGSLDALGVALPRELVLELAQAEWQLARAEAISTAMALAAAGAFDDLSITLEELLDLIADADFDPSNFAPPPLPQAPRPQVSATSLAEERDRFLEELSAQIKEWNQLSFGPLTQEAIGLRERFDELKDEAKRLNVATGGLNAAWRKARKDFVDNALAPFERLGESPLERELNDLNAQFDDLSAAFREIGASSSEMLRLEAARAAAFEDFWDRATAPLQSFLDEMRANDPRVSSEQKFVDAQTKFRDLSARAQAGDLEALGLLEAAARDFRDQAGLFLGQGAGSNAVFDEITSALEAVIGGGLGGDGGGDSDPVRDEIRDSNRYLSEILKQLGGELEIRPSDRARKESLRDAKLTDSDRKDRASFVGSKPKNAEPIQVRFADGDPPPIFEVLPRPEGAAATLVRELGGLDGASRAALLELVSQGKDRAQQAARDRARESRRAEAELEQRERIADASEATHSAIVGLRSDAEGRENPAGGHR